MVKYFTWNEGEMFQCKHFPQLTIPLKKKITPLTNVIWFWS